MGSLVTLKSIVVVLVLCMVLLVCLSVHTGQQQTVLKPFSNQEDNFITARVPVAYDVLNLCEQICDKKNESCFAPNDLILIYKDKPPLEQMTFRQRFSPLVQWRNLSEIRQDVGNKKYTKRPLCQLEDIDRNYGTVHKHSTCSIVGNGGIVLGGQCGGDIDSNDLVIRANFAKLDGYAVDVGRKTSIMMINDETLTNMHNTLIVRKSSDALNEMTKYIKQHLNDSIIWFAKGTEAHNSHDRLHQIAKYFRDNQLQPKLAYSLVDSTQAVYRKWPQIQNYPSSGLDILAIAETFCKNITLYGFYPYEKDMDGRTVSHHYYEPNVINFKTRNHNFDKEHKMLKSMHEKGTINLIYNPCVEHVTNST